MNDWSTQRKILTAVSDHTDTSPIKKTQKNGVIQMTGSQGSKRRKSTEETFDPQSVALFVDKFIVKSKFVVDYLQLLEMLEFERIKRAEEKGKGMWGK